MADYLSWSIQRPQRFILLVREQKVILDRELAAVNGTERCVLNQDVKRNIKRFPSDFMLELKREEIPNISQILTCSDIHKARRAGSK